MASKRQYCTIEEVEQLADVTSTNTTEFEDRISQAEELVDAYIGYQERFIEYPLQGKLTSASSRTLFDTSSDTPLHVQNNYFTFCVVEIVAGTGIGQQRTISSSSQNAYSITVSEDWDTEPDSTSIYKIYQLGKFPRCTDYFFDPDTNTYYKSIPEAVKRAVASQVAFMINQGDAFFAGGDSDMESESIDTYSYSKGTTGGASSSVKLLSPRSRTLLKGLTNRTGRLIADNPTEL